MVDGNGSLSQVIAELDGNDEVLVGYLYGDDLVSQNRGGERRFYHYDGLGSTRALSDSSGVQTDSYDYDAFGEVLGETGSTEKNYRYTGEQIDPNTGNYYLRARFYNPGSGRFLSMDSFDGVPQDPITLHKYLYGNADPVNMVDLSGNFSMASVSVANNIRMSLTNMQIEFGLNGLDSAFSDSESDSSNSFLAAGIAAIGGVGFKLLRVLSGKYRAACNLNSFTEDTLVYTESGLKPISEIKIGDKLWAYSEDTGEKSLQEVIHLIQSYGQKELIEIKFETGELITATNGHPFYSIESKLWIHAGELSPDLKLFDFFGNPLVIASVTGYTQNLTVYNLSVSNDHSYYVSQDLALSHNANVCNPDIFLSRLSSKGLLVEVGITKKGFKKNDYLFKNRSDAMNWVSMKLGCDTTRLRNARGKVIGVINSRGNKAYWAHGDWINGPGKSQFPHLNFDINGITGHLFLGSKIKNTGLWTKFAENFGLLK